MHQPHTPYRRVGRLSLFSASLQTFCLAVRAYLNRQKYELFCSLARTSYYEKYSEVFNLVQFTWPTSNLTARQFLNKDDALACSALGRRRCNEKWAANLIHKFGSRKIRFHLINWTRWNNSREVSNSANYFFIQLTGRPFRPLVPNGP